MDDIKERILEYVLTIDPTLDDDELDDLVAYTLDEVVDRVLAYTNRYQLVDQYELDLEDETLDEDDYVLPIPVELERVIARTVVNAYKSYEAAGTNEQGVSSMTDNGQSVTYKGVLSYMSQPDDEVFKGSIALLNKFRLPSVIENSR